MKTLKMSSFAAVIACLTLFASCTKDVSAPPAAKSSPTSEDYLSGARKGGPQMEEIVIEAPQKKADATANLAFDPAIAPQGSTVTLSGMVNFSQPAKDFTVHIETATEKDLAGNWIWADYGYQAPTLTSAVTELPVSLSFTAEKLGISVWRIHFAGKDVNQFKSEPITLEIIKACEGLQLEALTPVVTASEKGNDIYDFTVTYKVTSCKALQNAKLQGGLTAVSAYTASADANGVEGNDRSTNNSNYIINWQLAIGEGYENTFTVKFSKEIKAEGPHQITGSWSVEGIDPETGLPVRVEVPPVVYTK